MIRLTHQRYAEAIGAAFAMMPPPIRDRLAGTHFLTNTDPVIAGLHRFTATSDGRPYSHTPHAVYVEHQPHLPAALRAPTIVLPVMTPPEDIVHELGHILHGQLRFEPHPRAVSEYGATDRWEAFACAFGAWLCPPQDPRRTNPVSLQNRDLLLADRETMALFDSLIDNG